MEKMAQKRTNSQLSLRGGTIRAKKERLFSFPAALG
jgi:hypothetical protein